MLLALDAHARSALTEIQRRQLPHLIGTASSEPTKSHSCESDSLTPAGETLPGSTALGDKPWATDSASRSGKASLSAAWSQTASHCTCTVSSASSSVENIASKSTEPSAAFISARRSTLPTQRRWKEKA